jgi:small conductance mechanosensitive channel
MNSVITNYDTQDKRRVDIDFQVAYDTDIEKVKNVINDIVSKHNLILKDSEVIVRLNKLNSNSLTVACRVWCNRPDYFTVFYDLNESVYKALKENNIIMQNIYELKK